MADDQESRVCAYCGLDHEIHGGCFTGKKPSELKALRDAEWARTHPTPETPHD